MGIEYAKNLKIKYYEVSAKTNTNINKIFEMATEDYLELNKRV